jgi:hypothetical protein
MSKPRLSYANVVATLALFAAVGGTSIAFDTGSATHRDLNHSASGVKVKVLRVPNFTTKGKETDIRIPGVVQQPAGSFMWVQVSGSRVNPAECYGNDDQADLDDESNISWNIVTQDKVAVYGESEYVKLGKTTNLVPASGKGSEYAELQPAQEVPPARARTLRLTFHVENSCTKGELRFKNVIVRVLMIG